MLVIVSVLLRHCCVDLASVLLLNLVLTCCRNVFGIQCDQVETHDSTHCFAMAPSRRQDWIVDIAQKPVDGIDHPPDICLIELGGTLGDLDIAMYLEALQQLMFKACWVLLEPCIGAPSNGSLVILSNRRACLLGRVKGRHLAPNCPTRLPPEHPQGRHPCSEHGPIRIK